MFPAATILRNYGVHGILYRIAVPLHAVKATGLFGVDPKGETASSPTPYRSMIIRFLPLVQRFMMTLSVKRRRAMLASIPIKE